MEIDILREVVLGIGKMFLNPLLYIAVIMSIYLGYRRVKRERKYFHRRILWGWSEFVGLFKEGLLWTLIISVLATAIGLTLPIEFLYFLTIGTIVALFVNVFHVVSPIITFASSLAVCILMYNQEWTLNWFGTALEGINVLDGAAVTITIVAGLLLVAEGLLIRKFGAIYASPIIENTSRGLKAVAFLSKKVWVLPIFFIVPGGVIPAFFPWWPQFSLGATEFSIVLFPVVLGFQQMARHTLPIYFYPRLGHSVLILGELVIIGGLVGYFQPIVALIALGVGAVARVGISSWYAVRERKDVYAVSAKSNGAMIAAVLPNSPAEKMGLVAGEIIRKVNGVEVHTEAELYEALQINAAHCRLEVLDHNNELRLTQHVVYSDDHYRIGLLLAEA